MITSNWKNLFGLHGLYKNTSWIIVCTWKNNTFVQSNQSNPHMFWWRHRHRLARHGHIISLLTHKVIMPWTAVRVYQHINKAFMDAVDVKSDWPGDLGSLSDPSRSDQPMNGEAKCCTGQSFMAHLSRGRGADQSHKTCRAKTINNCRGFIKSTIIFCIYYLFTIVVSHI